MGLFFAAILSLTATIILLMVDVSYSTETGSIALLIAFLVGIGAQLFEHLNPELIKRTAKVYLGVFGASAIFFICVWLYMESLFPGFGIWVAIVLAAIFAYALLPEKPK